jgi:hypothetical protein
MIMNYTKIFLILICSILSFILYSCFLFPMSEFEYHIENLEETKITALDAVYSADFGTSISLSSDKKTLVVGAPDDTGKESSTGSVYVYKWNGTTWDEEKIIANDGEDNDSFGDAVSITADGKRFIAGASYSDGNYYNSGSVYVYTWNDSDWDEVKILASDGENGDTFGDSVSIAADGESFIVGAPHDDDNGDRSGSVYVYTWNGSDWDEVKILASDGENGDEFGDSVSIAANGESFIVGASEDNDNGSDSGSVYMYNWNGSDWDETKVLASDGENSDRFGYSVSITADGNTFLAGTPGNTIDGSVYIYHLNDGHWDEAKKKASIPSDQYGSTVLIGDDWSFFMVGAPMDRNVGAVFIYHLDD